MSEETEQALPCHEKLAFPTRAKAQAAATTEAFLHGTKLHAYKCRYCGLWHLSSSSPDTD